jgi:perosamine synthetase
MMSIAEEIIERVRAAVGAPPQDLQSPLITEKDANAVHSAVTYKYEAYVGAFEQIVREITGAGHVVALSSGTAALHLALLEAGVKPGDEVIVPTLTFAATAFAVRYCGAMPHFVDSREIDLGINPFKLRQHLNGLGRQALGRIKAIVPVHLLGMPCAIEELREIAAHFNLALVEDAAEALGTRTASGLHAGLGGRSGILSFNCNKIVTTGGGGALITDSEIVANAVRHWSRQSKVDHPYHWGHDALGFNYRMPAMCAALGASQLSRFDAIITAKLWLARSYYAEMFGVPQLARLIGIKPEGTANHWINAILLGWEYQSERDAVIEALCANGYESRALFTPLHTLPIFHDCPRQKDLSVAESIFQRAICLPSTP